MNFTIVAVLFEMGFFGVIPVPRPLAVLTKGYVTALECDNAGQRFTRVGDMAALTPVWACFPKALKPISGSKSMKKGN